MRLISLSHSSLTAVKNVFIFLFLVYCFYLSVLYHHKICFSQSTSMQEVFAVSYTATLTSVSHGLNYIIFYFRNGPLSSLCPTDVHRFLCTFLFLFFHFLLLQVVALILCDHDLFCLDSRSKDHHPVFLRMFPN